MRSQVQTLQSIARVSGVGTYFHQAVWKISVTKCTRWVGLLSWHESIILATISWTGCLGMLQIRKKKVNKWYTLRCDTEQWWLMKGGRNSARLQKETDSDCRRRKTQTARCLRAFNFLQRYTSKFIMYTIFCSFFLFILLS